MNRLIGILFIITSAASFGTLAIFGRYAYQAGLDTPTLLFLRFTSAALLMALVMLLRRQPLPRGRALLLLIAMGGIGYVAQSFCYLTAIKFASAGLVALLLYLYPTFVALLSVLILKARLTRPKVIALVFATIGTALTANPQGGEWTGILLALSAAAIYAVYIIVGARVMQQVSPLQSSTVIFASAGAVFAPLSLLNGLHWPQSLSGWWPVAAVSIVATIIPVFTFLAGLQRIGPTDASMLSTFEPIVTVLLAALLFSERLSLLALLGGGFILAAVLILVRGELKINRNTKLNTT
ncbi:MAG: EamA family transporter [Anaerolineales bacterium]|nr:EamA family transporter [Anaerolineales bacterium]